MSQLILVVVLFHVDLFICELGSPPAADCVILCIIDLRNNENFASPK